MIETAIFVAAALAFWGLLWYAVGQPQRTDGCLKVRKYSDGRCYRWDGHLRRDVPCGRC